jgi:hypothetical protein
MTVAIELGGIKDPNVARALQVLAGQVPTPMRLPRYTTALRPPAAGAGQGAMILDTTLNKPVFSDGTSWRDAAGTVV